MLLLGKIMILQRVGHPISCLGVCYANDPQKGGYMTPAPALDLTTSLRGDLSWYYVSRGLECLLINTQPDHLCYSGVINSLLEIIAWIFRNECTIVVLSVQNLCTFDLQYGCIFQQFDWSNSFVESEFNSPIIPKSFQQQNNSPIFSLAID